MKSLPAVPPALLRLAPRAVLAGALLLGAAPARAWDWPRLGLYGSMMGIGYPLWDMGGTLDPAVLDAMARYHEVILDVSPITPYRPDAIAALRARRPDISLLAYVLGQIIWDANDPDSLVHIPTRINHRVRDLDAFLYNTAGEKYHEANINLAKRDQTGHYIMAEWLADFFADAILKTGLWDGVFVDIYCDAIVWTQAPGDSIDYRRAGYASIEDFDLGWRAGADTLANRLRRLGGPAVVLVGNCGQGTRYASFNGWMRENFPFQNGGTWYSNMYRDPGGYFTDEAKFRTPRHNYLFSAVEDGTAPYSPTNTRKVRFGLGSAALGGGFGVFGFSDRTAKPYPYHEWWYDEYAVDLGTGMASADIRHTGWLGQPLGDPYQMIWVGSAPDAVTNPGFESDATSGWTFIGNLPATLDRDSTTAAVGTASVHFFVPSTTSYAYNISLSSVGNIPMWPGLQYSATFWAKAATPRTIRVSSARLGASEFFSRAVTLTTAWKQYQVTFVAREVDNTRLQFHLGGEAGDVWLDDCHFQPGATSIYRRDFQNGIVLVNPSDDPLTVELERDYRRIVGRVDPAVNDGATVTRVTIEPSDALFLIGSDRIPPATITNLRRIP